jgi:thiamine kinase-like enzyme
VLAAASAAGLAPAIQRCEPAQGILVADWVPGRTLSAGQAFERNNIDAIAELLRRVHALPIPQPERARSPAQWIAHYCAALGRVDADAPALRGALRGAAEDLLPRLGQAQGPPVLCHSDLHRHNVAMCERPVLIDWEYAHVSEPFWDLSGWVSNNDGRGEFCRELLECYLGRPAHPAEHARLAMMIWLYEYVCLLWSELFVRLRPVGAEQVSARARQLEGRLATAGGRAGPDPAH